MTDTTTQNEDHHPRERILNAAIDLFAEKGFAATGVRQIAARANVNISMINYYFGSKTKVLEAIIELTGRKYGEVLRETLDEPTTDPQRVRQFFQRIIETVRENPKLLRITATEMHYSADEIAAFKADTIGKMVAPILRAFMQQQLQPPGRQQLQFEMIGPLIPGMIVFHFLVAPVFSRVAGVELDDDFYERFADQLSDLVLYGLIGRLPEGTEGKGHQS